jgi:hypothetical protein
MRQALWTDPSGSEWPYFLRGRNARSCRAPGARTKIRAPLQNLYKIPAAHLSSRSNQLRLRLPRPPPRLRGVV